MKSGRNVPSGELAGSLPVGAVSGFVKMWREAVSPLEPDLGGFRLSVVRKDFEPGSKERMTLVGNPPSRRSYAVGNCKGDPRKSGKFRGSADTKMRPQASKGVQQ